MKCASVASRLTLARLPLEMRSARALRCRSTCDSRLSSCRSGSSRVVPRTRNPATSRCKSRHHPHREHTCPSARRPTPARFGWTATTSRVAAATSGSTAIGCARAPDTSTSRLVGSDAAATTSTSSPAGVRGVARPYARAATRDARPSARVATCALVATPPSSAPGAPRCSAAIAAPSEHAATLVTREYAWTAETIEATVAGIGLAVAPPSACDEPRVRCAELTHEHPMCRVTPRTPAHSGRAASTARLLGACSTDHSKPDAT